MAGTLGHSTFSAFRVTGTYLLVHTYLGTYLGSFTDKHECINPSPPSIISYVISKTQHAISPGSAAYLRDGIIWRRSSSRHVVGPRGHSIRAKRYFGSYWLITTPLSPPHFPDMGIAPSIVASSPATAAEGPDGAASPTHSFTMYHGGDQNLRPSPASFPSLAGPGR